MNPTNTFRELDAQAVDAAAGKYFGILERRDPQSATDELWFESDALVLYREQGYLSFEVFERLYWWKNRPYMTSLEEHFRRNTPECVREATSMAFAADSEQEGLRCLMGRPSLLASGVSGPGLLEAVGVPTASAILYWMKPEEVVIIDRKVMRSVFGCVNQDLTLQHQQDLSPIVRRKAKECGCMLRHLDRALWVLGDRRRGR